MLAQHSIRLGKFISDTLVPAVKKHPSAAHAVFVMSLLIWFCTFAPTFVMFVTGNIPYFIRYENLLGIVSLVLSTEILAITSSLTNEETPSFMRNRHWWERKWRWH